MIAGAAGAADAPPGMDWAYPAAPRVLPQAAPPPDPAGVISRPGAARTFTHADISGLFNPPDWFPDEHPPMPEVVSHGRSPNVWACAVCHLPTGAGHPDSGNVMGMNADYLARQMADFKSEARQGFRSGSMRTIAKSITDEEIKAAGAYFASIKPMPWTKVVETTTVPKTYVDTASMRYPVPNGGTEPIGNRIIELPSDNDGAEYRDPHTGFVAYVPPGSIKRGEALATTGGNGKTTPCVICHGPDLKGLGDVPMIAGHSAIYVVRQLHDIQSGARNGPGSALMKSVVAKLGVDDMIALAAYVSSRTP
jgi:cytochrome c553